MHGFFFEKDAFFFRDAVGFWPDGSVQGGKDTYIHIRLCV